MTLLVLAVPMLFALSLCIGSVSIDLTSMSEVERQIVLMTRLPSAVVALCCGAGLGVAGLQMQTIFRNPLAGPSVLGVSSASSLGVGMVVLMSGMVGSDVMTSFGLVGNAALTLSSLGGAVVALALIMWLGARVKDSVTLLIVGVLIGYIASAVIGVLKYFASEEDVHSYVIWGLGSFGRVSGGQTYVFASLMAVLVPLSFLLAKPLNMLLIGEAYARNLGLDTRRARLLVILSAGSLVAIATAYCGPIMFVGLAVPHIARGLLSTADHRVLLPASALVGAILAMGAGVIARLPGLEGALPINSVTALVGAPVALNVILRKKKR